MQRTASKRLSTTLPTMQLRDVSEGSSSVYTQRLLEPQTASYDLPTHVANQSAYCFRTRLMYLFKNSSLINHLPTEM